MSKAIQGTSENATKVVIRGTVFPREEKAPYTLSGYSILGGLECSEDEEKIKCHECGEWMKMLTARHLRRDGLTHAEYRQKHGLRRQTSVAAPVYRKRCAAHANRLHSDPSHRSRMGAVLKTLQGKRTEGIRRTAAANDRRIAYSELANLRMNCQAQLTTRLTNLAAKLGHTPTAKELERGDARGGFSRRVIEWSFEMTVSEALHSIGLVPNPAGLTVRMQHIPRQILQMRGQGLSYSQIAARLCIHRKTASKYSRTANS